jgi:hypothetical protein
VSEPRTASIDARPPRFGAAIFIAVFAFLLATSSREPAWGDAHPMWDVAEHLVNGSIETSIRWPEDIPPGVGGKLYGIAPIGPSLAHVPGAALLAISHRAAPSYDPLVRPLATHVGPAALGALAAVLFFALLRDLGRSARTASACTAIFVVATTLWVYARYPYSEILQLACFLGLARAVVRVLDRPESRREALWLGAWAGLLLNAKYVFAIAIAGAAVAIAWRLRARRAELARVLGWATVAGAPLALLALGYNYARWGSPFSTGYEPYLDAYFGGSVLDGAWGMLLSPGKSALLFSPPLVLALFGLPRAIRAAPSFGLVLVAMVAPTLLVYCTYRSWSGEYAWGPRFFVWAVPVVLVGLAAFLDDIAARWRRRVRLAIVGGVVAFGVVVQLLGNALYWDHFIRVAITVKNQWLGNPNRAGAYVPVRGRPHCDSCFEDTYEVLWTPPFNQIRGHWWLVRSLALGDDADSAQDAAPWRRYTSLRFPLGDTFARARIDWWGLVWMKDATQTWPLGLALLVVFVVATTLGVLLWIRLHRAEPP